jgi:hypothetical protein
MIVEMEIPLSTAESAENAEKIRNLCVLSGKETASTRKRETT